MQLFCLTYAGGTAAFYNQLDAYFDNSIDIVKLEYSGHGKRHKEMFYDNFFELAEDMYGMIKESLTANDEYALIGYSMGSISLVEILNLIIDRNEIPYPKYVFLAAHEPIQKSELVEFKNDEFDERVKERTIRFGGVPEKLINNNSFWRVYLPMYQNDYSIIGKYDFNSLNLKTDIPAVIFYSPTDTRPEDMTLWSRYFTGTIEYFEFEGNHFFIQQHCEEMCNIISKRLKMEDLQ